MTLPKGGGAPVPKSATVTDCPSKFPNVTFLHLQSRWLSFNTHMEYLSALRLIHTGRVDLRCGGTALIKHVDTLRTCASVYVYIRNTATTGSIFQLEPFPIQPIVPYRAHCTPSRPLYLAICYCIL